MLPVFMMIVKFMFVGNVIEISEQYNKIHVKFMKKMENAFCGPLKMTHVGFLCSIAWDM